MSVGQLVFADLLAYTVASCVGGGPNFCYGPMCYGPTMGVLAALCAGCVPVMWNCRLTWGGGDAERVQSVSDGPVRGLV